MSNPEPNVKEQVLAMMRANHHLVEPSPYNSHAADLPPLGSPERARLETEIATELGEALARTGLSVLDLIERR